MKNLKRVLSLGLASVMLLGMMVMGASAANFNDAEDIENVDAVNLMVALNVINGKDDGSFDPNGAVTRAEMAKMITMILFGGEEPTLASNPANPKFTDIGGHWAQSFIEYCASNTQGIIAGLGDGTFAPAANVTGTAAAKMALVALGYNAQIYGFENNRDWELNINSQANAIKLYDGLGNINPSNPLTRDQAAQLLYNALNAKTMVPQYTITNAGVETSYTPNGPTLMTAKFTNVDENVTGLLTKVEYSDGVFTYTISGEDGDTVEYTEDVSDLFMQNVKVIRKDQGKKTETILGIAPVDSTVLTTKLWGDKKVNSAKTTIDGFTVNVSDGDDADDVPVYEFNGEEYVGTPEDYFTYTLINNTGSNKVDCIVVYPFSVEEVTYVGSKTITTTGGTYSLEDDVIYSGVKTGDWAKVTKGASFTSVEKIDEIEGTVTATRDGEVRVSGTWYTAEGTFTIGDTYSLVVVNNNIFSAEVVDEDAALSDVAYVVAAAEDVTHDDLKENNYQTIRLLFANGNREVVRVVEIDDKTVGDADAPATLLKVGALVTYSVNRDGNYEITAIDTANYDRISTDASGTDIDFDNGVAKQGTVRYRFNSNSVIFFTDTSDDNAVTVITGDEIAAWDDETFSAATDVLYANQSSNGLYYVSVGALSGDGIPGATGTATLGWIVNDRASIVKDGDKWYIEMTIWNGSDEVTVLADESNNRISSIDSKYTTEGVILYEDLGNGKITLTKAGTSDLGVAADAVLGVSGNEVEFETAGSAEITDKTKVIYMDTAENTGAEGGSVVRSATNAAGGYTKNVYVAVDGGEVTYLIVDITNQLDGLSDTITTATGTYITDVTAAGEGEDRGTIQIASNANGNQVADEAAAWGNGASVLRGATRFTGVIDLTDGATYTLRVCAEDGTIFLYTIVE